MLIHAPWWVKMEFNRVKSMNTPSTFKLQDKQLLYDEFKKLSIFSRLGIMLGRQVFVMRLKGLKFYAWRCKDCGNIGISYVHGYDSYLQCKYCLENTRQLDQEHLPLRESSIQWMPRYG
jgi:hypothetical protein